MDSFTEATLRAEQAHQMRALGVLAIVNNLTPRYENVITRHKEPLMSIRAVAGDINEDGQALARRSTLVLTFGGFIAVALGLTIGYLMARFFSRSVIHIADVATQAASGRLQARAKLDTHVSWAKWRPPSMPCLIELRRLSRRKMNETSCNDVS